MNVNTILLLILSIQFLISGSNESDPLSEHFRNEFGNEFMEKVLGNEETKIRPTNSEGASSRDIFISGETSTINIIRNFISPKRDGGFFKGENIEVLVKITTQKKGGLKQIEFWEIPDEDLNITYCSYQVRTSNVQQMLHYEEQNDSFLKGGDILYPTMMAKLLVNNPLNQTARQELDNYIYKQLSNDTKKLLKELSNDTFNESPIEEFKGNLSKDLNKIINNSSTDILMLFNKCNIKVDRKRVLTLNPNSSAYHDSKDYRLQKRLMLEHIYPKLLKNLSYSKEHECLNLVENQNAIRIIEKNLHQGETIIFKYCLHLVNLGPKDIRYIIRADDYLQEGVETIMVSEREENFSISYWCDSKDITINQDETFDYEIEYLGGNGELNSFHAIIKPPEGCEIKSIAWEDKSNSSPKFEKDKNNSSWQSKEKIPFSKGRRDRLSIVAVFNKTKSRISPPVFKIGNFTKKFDSDLAVYADYDTPFRIHFEFYSIFLTIGAIIISLIVAIFSSLEIYLANKEIHLIHAETRIAHKQLGREKEQRLSESSRSSNENK